jgi:formate-dependent nitrite reductase membrane component NrfD
MAWNHDSVLFHLVWAVVAGIAAGATFFIGYYWREKKQSAAMRRIERFLEWTILVTLSIVEVHNEFHPEAKIETQGLSKLLFDASSHPFDD